MASSTSENPPTESQPRENMIDTAVRFLTNPNVVDRPIQQKQSFLRSKGMTDSEIHISFERANVQNAIPQQTQSAVIPMYGVPHHAVAPQHLSVWIRMRDFLHTLALLGGLGYAVYWVYKSYIEPFLFGRPKPKKSAAESLSCIEEAVNNVSRCTSELRTELRTELNRISQERESSAVRTLADIKSDVATVKGLLLSRQQFPSAPNSSSLRTGHNSKPSIPAWQMSTEQKISSREDDELSSDTNSPTHSHSGAISKPPSDSPHQKENSLAADSSNVDTAQSVHSKGSIDSKISNGSPTSSEISSN